MIAALSTRAIKAVEVLKNGGEFRYALETDPYTKRTQFKARLLMKGKTVKGFGHAVFSELRPMLVPTAAGTSVSTYYTLSEV
jgi:hypothetical protein